MIAGREGIPVVLFALESGMPEMLRVLEKYPKRLRQLIVLLDKRLIVDLFQKRRASLVFRRCRDEERACFDVKPLLIRQHLIPDVPAAAKGLFKQLRLFR